VRDDHERALHARRVRLVHTPVRSATLTPALRRSDLCIHMHSGQRATAQRTDKPKAEKRRPQQQRPCTGPAGPTPNELCRDFQQNRCERPQRAGSDTPAPSADSTGTAASPARRQRLRALASEPQPPPRQTNAAIHPPPRPPHSTVTPPSPLSPLSTLSPLITLHARPHPQPPLAQPMSSPAQRGMSQERRQWSECARGRVPRGAGLWHTRSERYMILTSLWAV
jgi:hypothetical protein